MKEKLFSAFASLGNAVFAAVPKVAVGLLLLVLGLLAAKLIEVVMRTMLVRLRLTSWWRRRESIRRCKESACVSS
jgi:hypothetical protein